MRSGKAGQREEAGDVSLAPAMDRSRRRTHQEVALLIGFYTIWSLARVESASTSAQRAVLFLV